MRDPGSVATSGPRPMPTAAPAAEGASKGKKIALINVTGQAENSSFVRGCLQTSRPTAGFCDGVPSRSKNIFVAWDEKQCEQSDDGNVIGKVRPDHVAQSSLLWPSPKVTTP